MARKDYCQACGTRVEDNDEFCPKCGGKQLGSHSNDDSGAKKTTWGVIFGWFFGVLLLLAAVGALSDAAFFSTIILLIMGFTLIPPTNKVLRQFGLEIPPLAKIVIIVVGLFLISLLEEL